jgi:Protein of unknown function (DUF3500)
VTAARRRVAQQMAAEAERLVASFDASQRHVACWSFPAHDERRRWFYTPTDHGGLTLAEMSTPQHRLVHRLLASALSTAGYVTASTILGLENVLDQLEGFVTAYDRPRGRDPLLYYIRLFGTPSPDGTWGWRFGGHHISLNFTIIDGELGGLTPLFFGADPASSPLLGPHPLRPLAGVEDLARELTRSLPESQQGVAIVTPRAPTDIVGANRSSLNDGDEPIALPLIWRGRFGADLDAFLHTVQAGMETAIGITPDDLAAMAFTHRPKGLAARDMGPDHREMLDALLHLYVKRLPDDVADEEAQKFAGAALDDVHLLWAGGLQAGQPHYYRLHGPTVLVEYDNSARGANHVHTVWRDPRGDFADDPLARHHHDHH